jgi:SAM-dependent methyltransferase
MLNPTPDDIKALDAWPSAGDPEAGLRQFRPSQLWLRWLKPVHLYHYTRLWRRRAAMARAAEDLQAYYRDAVIPHERRRWEYLKRRKAWFIPEWRWEAFGHADCSRILDAGCGDGDVTQRLADNIARNWKGNGGGHPLEITGLDLNRSRIDNCKELCASPHPDIALRFRDADITRSIPFDDGYFDYAIMTGVLETLVDACAERVVAELARTVRKGVYIEDLADRFPGGYPRDLTALLTKYGFRHIERRLAVTEPFSLLTCPDPCWKDFNCPILKIQVLFAQKTPGNAA